ncbi:hypothetical protein TRFO_38182 [Tritrichomonas foetus]|uniref:Uncharacterized protein n=1 Tax=Tritrichomonas foetus TaxID=1144522 RepID=A0A1J4JDC1_9EUKA|nr:hypothetical protein TRFO_38182 [Tritrichomonas foetus]|eukprot:OHS95675.1 hypothetical protein TRFO_38182 [Tritrichomonas foetus]
MKRSPYESILYTPSLNFREIFQNIGDSIQVFIPIDLIKNEAAAISQETVFGNRPYSINSDILAMTVHMGIIFPDSEKKLFWLSSETCFTPEKEGERHRFEHVRTINDEFGLAGVFVTVVATAPLERYPSAQRYSIKSHEEISDGAPFSLDIPKAFLATSYEQPKIVSDYSKIIRKFFDPTTKIGGPGYLPYMQEYFTPQTLDYLLNNYQIHLFGENNSVVTLKRANKRKISVVFQDDLGNTNEVESLKIEDMDFRPDSFAFLHFSGQNFENEENYTNIGITSFSVV